ncbi:MAG: N-6 DNA methylase [Candidatus Binatus sp.]|uniref:HsdM family class I SAM-dependent methyltransferase n=1 Tax=Candidatus Binatus sp. TaxID=2811406 RepID=UPI00271DACAD|nr:N-6 DNA methylase [Candidatus Binatus sp.]MDO8432754.1 N-6 DNA methylase [Candidatus Binatus sp.]
MAVARAGVTERTFYPPLLKVISDKGGSGVQEVSYNSFPDIVFNFRGRPWILSVKIGESLALLKDAFLQYLRHKQESRIEQGLLLILPEAIRRVRANEQALLDAILNTSVSVIVDAGDVKEEYRDRPFPVVLDRIRDEIYPLLEKRGSRYYPLQLVVDLLKTQVAEAMRGVKLEEKEILNIITDKKLLTDLGHLQPNELQGVTRFLAAYIVLSQILFLRLFRASHPDIVPDPRRIDRSHLRKAFRKVLDINYRDIFELEVLDAVEDKYIHDTFDLIWGLEIERVRYELPGRIFHQLMPSEIRKVMAAFYTRPQAAELLARLAIDESGEEIFDPACGSGTILVSAYRRKVELFRSESKGGLPHKRFCEDEILGSDIMPFAVHLTAANLSAMAIEETLAHTQISHGDSIKLAPGTASAGLQMGMFPIVGKGKRRTGDQHTFLLKKVDAVLMNPPFTKVERGIKNFVDMEKFKPLAGGEVGLWGHFVFLAAEFLKENGTCGAVIPINVLRGRESANVRDFLFQEWTVKYVLKPTFNYAFSEWAEYRDVIIVAKNQRPPRDHLVKFALVKTNLRTLTDEAIDGLAASIKTETVLRSDSIDIDSHPLSEVLARKMNMMWFCGVTDFRHRETLVAFAEKFKDALGHLSATYFREGYRPVPKGVSQFLFFTRAVTSARTDEAFMSFDTENSGGGFRAKTHANTYYEIDKDEVVPTVRTLIGYETMDITGLHDYISHDSYGELTRVQRACGFTTALPKHFWTKAQRELNAVKTSVLMCHRINPYAPSTNLIAFFSDVPISPSNQANVILETDPARGRAIVCLLNSAIFLAQFFLLKEESTGRLINIRFYDVAEMFLKPSVAAVEKLQRVYEKFRLAKFPSLREQMDEKFEFRYEEFWAGKKLNAQHRLFSVLDQDIAPAAVRMDFDLDICRALDIEVDEEALRKVYGVIVKEMIMTRHLTKD